MNVLVPLHEFSWLLLECYWCRFYLNLPLLKKLFQCLIKVYWRRKRTYKQTHTYTHKHIHTHAHTHTRNSSKYSQFYLVCGWYCQTRPNIVAYPRFFMLSVLSNYIRGPTKHLWSTLHKKWSFPLRVSSLLLKKSLMENFIFCAVRDF